MGCIGTRRIFDEGHEVIDVKFSLFLGHWQTAEHVAFPEALRLVSSGKCILGPDGKAIRS